LREHPTPAELEAFATGNLPPGSFWRTARHLLQGCPSCKALLAPYYESLLPLHNSEPSLLDRVLSVLRSRKRYIRREEIRQRKSAAFLEGGGGYDALMADSRIPLRGLGVLKALLDRSWAVRHENLGEMKELARVAVDVATRLDPRWHDERDAADWQARAWGELGNARRASDDLDEAERAFGASFDFFLQGTRDARLKARLHDLYASYLGTRRQFDLAFAALDIVYSTYLELGDSHLAGRALVIKAMFLHYSSRPEEALTVNQQARTLIDKDRDPSLLSFSIHNQLLFFVACGRFPEARRELFIHLGELQACDGRIYKLRLRWLQAQISAGMNNLKSAESGLLHVKLGFEQEGMGLHAAIASLELALVWMRQDRHEETEKIVLEVYDVFVALRIQREAFGAVMVLKEAFERRMGTIGLLEDAVDFLRRWYVNPNERFMPRGE
jgi:tetratricopeptide (TPR) repeat protein